MDSRSARKHQAILDAATAVFLDKGYAGTSMDDIAKLAAVSKQTVYKHFSDKEKLFAEIVLATTDRLDTAIDLLADVPADAAALEENLTRLARQFLDTLTHPRVIQLRRLIIANADVFPDLGTEWYEKGFERGSPVWPRPSGAWPTKGCSASTTRSWPRTTSPGCCCGFR